MNEIETIILKITKALEGLPCEAGYYFSLMAFFKSFFCFLRSYYV